MKKIVLILATLILITFIGFIDGGVTAGVHPHTHKEYATIQVVVTLEDGNTYIAECYEGEVTIDDHFSEDPTRWEITKW